MSDRFEHWAVVELLGHKQLAGRVTEQEVAGCGFLRLDVPKTAYRPAFTKLIGTKSVYGITLVDETTAQLYAEELREHPVDAWRIANLLERQRRQAGGGCACNEDPERLEDEEEDLEDEKADFGDPC